jgi:tetratricopeptide (TPR) repeat protein
MLHTKVAALNVLSSCTLVLFRSRQNQNQCFTVTVPHVSHNSQYPCLLDSWVSLSKIGYINLSPPKLELVVQDCDEALKLNPDYVKALNRRATALEQLGQYENALRGMSFLQAFFVRNLLG